MSRPAQISPPTEFPIERHGKVLLLDYDQGLEHGPEDFDESTVDPRAIITLASEGEFTGIVLQKGLARNYYRPSCSVPLVIKLNGKTNLLETGDPYSPQICSVAEAKELGAKAVGYTIYLGSQFEAQMMKEFGAVVAEAHTAGLSVIAWMLPRGRHIHNPTGRDMVAYAARVGLELGADYVQVRYSDEAEEFDWVVASAGRCKVIAIVEHGSTELLEQRAEALTKLGAAGISLGRAVWQSSQPQQTAARIAKKLFAE